MTSREKKDWSFDTPQNEFQSPTKDEAEKEFSVHLTETFYISSKKNCVFQVKLNDKGLCLRKESAGNVKEQLIQIQDIIGCRCLRSQKKQRGRRSCTCSSLSNDKVRVVEDEMVDLDESDSSAYLYIYAYVLKKSIRNVARRERTVLTLRFRSFDKFEDNHREAQRWRLALRQLMSTDSIGRPFNVEDGKRMLIILNPKSGSGKAREFFQQQVAPIYVEAEISYDLHVTKYANFAREFVRSRDVFQWRGIVVVGGDGIFWEVVNGLMERQDWDDVFNNLPLGIIPCGSGNGLARTIAHLYDEPYDPKPILNAAIATVRRCTDLMDIVRVETKSEIMFSFLSVGWGFISDIDIESERLRSIGYQRFAIWSIRRLINLRTYPGKLSYIPINLDQEKPEESRVNTLKHSVSCNTYLGDPDHDSVKADNSDADFGDVISLETSGRDNTFRPRFDSWYSATSRKSAYYSVADSEYQSISERNPNDDNTKDRSFAVYGPSPKAPSLMTPVNEPWVTEEGDYVMVHAAYQSHLGSDCFFAPSSKLNDGIIWLVIIKSGVTRSQLLNFLLGLSTGTHLPEKNNEFIKFLPVSAFRIEPTGTEGILTVDGERVEYGPIQGEIFPGVVRVMTPK